MVLTRMKDETAASANENTDITDSTDTSLITDFTQVVSCAVGRDRAERRREKIRQELIEQYFGDPEAQPSSLMTRLRKLFASA